MYLFWLKIETEMLKYENCLYKLSIYHQKTKQKKRKKYTKRNLPYQLLRDDNIALIYLSLSPF